MIAGTFSDRQLGFSADMTATNLSDLTLYSNKLADLLAHLSNEPRETNRVTDATANPAHSELEPREERRLSPRSRMTEIVYVNMQAENGGILLDISASGFGFQVASPIAAEREIKFRFSAEGIEDLEITANIAWLDGDRKRGGVKFDQLPEKVRTALTNGLGSRRRPKSFCQKR